MKTKYEPTIESDHLSLTRERVDNWFSILQSVIDKYQIILENIYHLDETESAIGTVEASYIIVDKTIMFKYQEELGRQEWVTVLEYVCGDRSALAPIIIYKGEWLSSSWIPMDLDATWYFACSTNSWTSNPVAAEWIKRVFEPITQKKANGQTKLSICDGHESYISTAFAGHCF